MSTLLHTVQFNNPVFFTDHTGVKFVNTTTLETAGTVTSSAVSPTDLITYSVTWVTDPVAGDVIEWQYDSSVSGANYSSSSEGGAETVVMEDSFIGANAVLNGRTPDTVGTGTWTGDLQPEVTGLGQLGYPATTNDRLVVYDVGSTAKKVTFDLSFPVGANTNMQIGITTRGNDAFTAVLSCMVFSNGTFVINNRVSLTDDFMGGGVALTTDPKGNTLTFEIEDDGTDVTFTCVTDGISITKTPTDGITIPADNFVGTHYRNIPLANESFYDYIRVSTLGGGPAFPIDSQTLVLINCLDQVTWEVNFETQQLEALSFQRNSEAYYWDNTGTLQIAAVNEPRYDFDPVTRLSKGCYFEPARENIIPVSNNFQGIGWSGTATVTPNDGIGPDGLLSADLLTDSSGSFEARQISITIPNDSANYCASIFVEKGAGDCLLSMRLNGGTNLRTDVSLNRATGVVTPASGTARALGAKDCGNYWWLWISAPNDSSGNTTGLFYFAPATTGGGCRYRFRSCMECTT